MAEKLYRHPIVSTLADLLRRGLPLMHVLVGPRQVGKTTAASMIAEEWPGPVVHASADDPVPPGPEWIAFHWNRARSAGPPDLDAGGRPLLILDEIQKAAGWSETVKREWDLDARSGNRLAVLLLGSAALLVQRGLSESLAGRFLLHRLLHWDYPTMRAAFGLTLDEWLFFGGYPGTMRLIDDEELWRHYVRDALVEPAIARDVLQMEPVRKPALLRHLFYLACGYPAQILSYNKMLGQLVDAGNTTTLAHYLTLLDGAYLISGLESFKPGGGQKRGTSPKLIVRNNALVSAVGGRSFAEVRKDAQYWGRLVENAVGAHILNTVPDGTLFYWRKREQEVDFVIRSGDAVTAVEVKSSRMRDPAGLRSFLHLVPSSRPVIVGGSGIALEEFLSRPPI